jgi:hypothetical protein
MDRENIGDYIYKLTGMTSPLHWSQLFDDKQTLIDYALSFSTENKICESNEWANLKPENGLDGGCIGTHRLQSTKDKLSKANKGKKHSDKTKEQISNSNKGKHNISKSEDTILKIKAARKLQICKPHSEETKRRMSESANQPLYSCIRCKNIFNLRGMPMHIKKCFP